MERWSTTHAIALSIRPAEPCPSYVVPLHRERLERFIIDNRDRDLPPGGPPERRVANHYDRDYDYTDYWTGRDYENAAEGIAIRRLLHGRHFRNAADIGGGFGRHSLLLREYADTVTLAEPSLTQLAAAKDFLSGTDITQSQMQADDLHFETGALDLVLMVRVMHHIPEPTLEFAEIARVLGVGGVAVIEVANYGHAMNRLRHLRTRTPMPRAPVSISTQVDEEEPIPFVNHNIATVVQQLRAADLLLAEKLSVSNLRSGWVKGHLPRPALIAMEKRAQGPLAAVDFGPSIFLRLTKLGSHPRPDHS